MIRHALFALAFVFAGTAGATAQNPKAASNALLQAQGEYVGILQAGVAEGWLEGAVGAQLVAYADPKNGSEHLDLVLYQGGLPGQGWTRANAKLRATAAFADGTFADGTATFVEGCSAILRDGVLTVRSAAGVSLGDLQRTHRQSPTLGAAPPPNAFVLFDGASAERFTNGRLVAGSEANQQLLAAGCESQQGFQDHRIHLEFQTPFRPAARGQGRGNSGVYVQGRYECQVLDSFGLTGEQNECGGIYSIAAPIVNACLPPQAWQTYDIQFTAARFVDGKKQQDARMTVHLNGILVHDDVALPHATTAHPHPEGPEPFGIHLQDHGNPVVYRNVWVQERDANRTRNVVFLAGRPSHGYASHEHKAGCLLLQKALDESGCNVHTEVVDLWPSDPQILAQADVIVSFADGGGGHPFLRHMGEIESLMQRGVGLVCLHYAVEVPTGVPGTNFLRWLGGYFETHWSVNPHWVAEFGNLPTHAITRGVEPFAINDEWYFHMRFPTGMEAVTPILSAIAPASTMSRKDGPHSGNPAVRAAVAANEPQHVGWAHQRPDGGRSFGFTGGHVHWNWGNDSFRKVVLNAICWCAHAPVPKDGVASKTPDLAALQANQDSAPGDRFDAAAVQRLLDSFQK